MDERRIERIFELPAVVAALVTIPALMIENSSAGEPWTSVGSRDAGFGIRSTQGTRYVPRLRPLLPQPSVRRT